MSRCILYAFLACVVAFIGAHFIANREDVSAHGPDRIVSKASPISGKWSYRSFRSNPDLTAEPNALLFGLSSSRTLSLSPLGSFGGP